MSAKQERRKNRVVWFEIPASDLARATKFYETILSTSLKAETDRRSSLPDPGTGPSMRSPCRQRVRARGEAPPRREHACRPA